MGDVSNMIDEIITNRHSHIDLFDAAEQHIKDAHANIMSLKEYQKSLDEGDDPESVFVGNADIANNIMSISTNNFFDRYDAYIEELNRLKQRFSRDSINISFIGKAGQGKSLVMQKISGLDGTVIPSSAGDHCTGAKSVITNSDNTAVEARIEFFAEHEMIDIINKYLEKLTGGTNSIKRLSEIPQIDIEKIREDNDVMSSVEKLELCDHLDKYIKHFDEIEDHLGEIITVPKEEIEEYVAQYASNDGDRKYYKYLGVKLADIRTRFPHTDAGKIVLVDTIGMGATSLGVEEEMLNAVKNDSDVIIMMFRPDPLRHIIPADVVTTIDRISDIVSTDYTKEMLFIVLNKVQTGDSGDNTEGVKKIDSIVKSEKKYAIADVLTVNCMDEAEVENELLKPVLNRMASRLKEVDTLLIKKLDDKGFELYTAYREICKDLDRALVKSANEDLRRIFRSDINTIIERTILGGIRELYLHKYNNLRNEPCTELNDAAAEKLKNIMRCVPGRDKVLDILQRGNKNQTNVYEDCTNIMRMSIINDFNTLDAVLERVIEAMKKEIIHILADDDKGKLGKIRAFDCDSGTWINDFIEKTEAADRYPIIAEALKRFRDYSINVQGFLIHEVREQLDVIDISLPGQGVPQFLAPLSEPERVADQIVEWLKKHAEEINEKTGWALSDLYKVPNRSMFAAIKDLYDRFTYESEDTDNGVSDEWRDLFEDWMHIVWKERYQQESAVKNTVEQWSSLAALIKDMDKPEYFAVVN